MEGTIATIMMFAGNFAPKNWSFCNGQLINIASNTALFSLLGTNFGGNGTSNFGLPNLGGRVVPGVGNAPGLSPYSIGQTGGAGSVTLTTQNLPAHNHSGAIPIPVSNNAGTTDQANGNILATPVAETYASAGTAPAVNYGGGFAATVAPTGSSVPFSVMQPSVAMNFVICQFGVFPSRP